MTPKVVLLSLLCAAATAASAHERYFVFTYDWFTPARYERELEFAYDHFRDGGAFGQLELEYGLTDRWVVAPYILFSHDHGKSKFAGWKLEQRYRFGESGFNKLMPAVYLEVQKENGEPYELEAKLIGSFMPNANWIASGNLIVERKLETGSRAEVGYSAGVARIYPTCTIGIEAKGNFLENQHFFGPTAGFRIGPGSKMLIGAGLGFGKDTQSRVRILLEKEF
jgi:hypothetical protein